MLLKLHQDTHLDHGLTARQLAHVMLKLSSPGYKDAVAAQLHALHGGGPFIETLTIPTVLGKVPCNLYGPIMGDRPVPSYLAHQVVRAGRAYPSRVFNPDFSLNFPVNRHVDTITVIAGPYDGADFVLYTAFGGPIAPKEPDDPTIKDSERADSIAFWSEHALADYALGWSVKIAIVLDDGSRHAAVKPYPSATYVRAPLVCPHGCKAQMPAPDSGEISGLQISGSGVKHHNHDTYFADAIAICCKRKIGTIEVKVDTIFGIEEDERVTAGPWRVY